MPVTTVIILNPWAGRGLAGQKRPALESALKAADIPYTLLTTTARGAATGLTMQGLERGATTVVAVGGDGTINEVVNGLLRAPASSSRQVRLGVVPFGTGSDFIKMFDGMAAGDIGGAVRRLSRGTVRPVDAGLVRVDHDAGRYFINGLGMGLDAQAANEALKITRLKGLAVYLVAILRALVNYKAYPMTVCYDEARVQRRLLFTTIGNGRCQAGGFWLTPQAQIDDGLLDVCMIDNLRLDEILRYLPRVMKGTHIYLKQATMGRAREITVEVSAPIPVATDGEVIATRARQISVAVLPQVLEVLV